MIKEVFTEIGKINEFDEYKRYSLYMKGLILICTFCVYVSIILGLSIWGVSLTHLVYKIFSIVKSGSFLVSEIVITIIVYIGFTLGVSYISMFIGSKFVSLIDNIKIKECIKFNYKQCVNFGIICFFFNESQFNIFCFFIISIFGLFSFVI